MPGEFGGTTQAARPRTAFVRPLSTLNFAAFLFLLLLSTLLTTSCTVPAQSQGPQNANSHYQSRSISNARWAFADFDSADSDSAEHIVLSVSLPPAKTGTAYNSVISVTGGDAPYQFSIVSGALPPGLTLDPTTGRISGTPISSGTYKFAVEAADAPRFDLGVRWFTFIVAQAATSPVSVSISPDSTTVYSGSQRQFSATVRNTSNVALRWITTAGSVSDTGLFTAPAVKTPTTATVTAVSLADPSQTASATVVVNPTVPTPLPLAITSNSVPPATSGMAYSATLAASGGTPPYTWTIAPGALPQGLQVDSAGGTISGTPTQTGTFSFTVQVTDSASQTATQSLVLSVSTTSLTTNPTGFDGPAELPRVYVPSTMADTPAPGNLITVNAGGDFQGALNSVQCGETILLQAGATFTGRFTLPAKSCDDNHWVVIRTSAPDSSLPPEGTRVTPCYAGVSSLPGRPPFQCASPVNVMAKLVMGSLTGAGPLLFAPGANHYRLLGLEVTRNPGGLVIYDLTLMLNGGPTNHIVFDRVWMHGTATDETTRGVQLGGSTNVAVVDSYFNDFHCTASIGACGDSQAISGGTGSYTMGPYKIVNNFLEAAGENIIFGGGAAQYTAADIEIRRNHFFKPMTWMTGQPGFVGAVNTDSTKCLSTPGYCPFIVKNLFELKNAQRVLLECNILEDSWGGFSQRGFAVVLTPKNPSPTSTIDVCPTCQVTDVTIRNSTISHVGGAFQIANALSDTGWRALDGQRYSIHDVIADDINGVVYQGNGLFAQISTIAAPLLQNVKIDHVTLFQSKTMLNVGAPSGLPMPNFTFTNSIVNAGVYPIWSTGGGTANCAYYDIPLTTMNACFSPYTFSKNAIINPGINFLPAKWPAGNFFPTNAAALQFVNYNNGNGGDYHLLPSSPYKNAASDGTDLGANVDTVLSAVAGVQ